MSGPDPEMVRNVVREIVDSYGGNLSLRDAGVIEQVLQLLDDGKEVPRWQLVRLSTMHQRLGR